MFGLFKRRVFFSDEEKEKIADAIRRAEQSTCGEVRVFVESRCSWVDAIDRASELFYSLKMDKTAERNAVLVYVAMKDRQLAIFGDEGIHEKVGKEYWTRRVGELLDCFDHDKYADGISHCVLQIGEALKTHFPYNRDTDKNELPDDIVFGR